MFTLDENLRTLDKTSFYKELLQQTSGLLHDERDMIANMANIASLLFHSMSEINWSGFYLWKNGELVLGPFHGKPACVRIAMGRGVCGTAAERRETVVVEDVHAFPGHIACDAASRSEIVVPLVKNGKLVGVLDIDSPIESRFNNDDKQALERLAAALLDGSDIAD
ncbi:MAG: GAF domain-containing protein [Candidatus Kapabacteria bacterium]|jgi:GAF domain-containing protein|nr:GAF domain-containing protein [Candidatus Kapabacteria bacterium]